MKGLGLFEDGTGGGLGGNLEALDPPLPKMASTKAASSSLTPEK